MENEILKLRNEGKTYNQIVEILGCSKGLVSYYCGKDQKLKSKERRQKNRLSKLRINKVYRFCNKQIYDKVNLFKKKSKRGKKNRNSNNCSQPFTFKDLIAKFGESTKCYLTGRDINLFNADSYHLDHVVPPQHGGSNNLENVGITCPEANWAKSGFLLEEFIKLCQEILIHQGYKVEKMALSSNG